MPSMSIYRRLNTRPFASDDLHILCLMFGLFRVVQLVGASVLLIYLYIRKFQNSGTATGTLRKYCGDFMGSVPGHIDDLVVLDPNRTIDQEREGGKVGQKWLFGYTVASFVYVVLDLCLLTAIWSAASVGTPTQPRGREVYLRPLLRFKVVFTNFFLVGLVIVGIMMVYFNREDDFGCQLPGWEMNLSKPALEAQNTAEAENSGIGFSARFGPTGNGENFEDTGWYVLYCMVLVTQALELLIWPAIIANKIFRWIRRHEKLKGNDASRVRQGERFLGGCLKCCGILCCFKPGGRDLSANMNGQMKDAIKAVLDFFNDSGTLNIVFSDLYVSFKMLSRVQRERKLACIGSVMKLLKSENVEMGLGRALNGGESSSVVAGTLLSVGDVSSEAGEDESEHQESFKSALESIETDSLEETTPPRSPFDRRVSVFTLEVDGSEVFYSLKPRSVVSPSTQSDKSVITEAAHYIRHANAIYDYLPEYVIKRRRTTWLRNFARSAVPTQKDSMESSCAEMTLEEIGFEQTTVVYLQPGNGIAQTPYCIMIDEKMKAILVVIRGTASLEDIVIDLNLTPSCMDDIGKSCGFDGSNQFCHKGVLTRTRWLYSDLQRHNILDDLLLGDEPRCPEYQLVITGHSLGAGCASVLSMMLRHRFSALKCYAFCPPGGLLSEKLADYCQDFVISLVNNTDVIPRMSYENLERLRDEALEVLARIRISKIKLIRVLSKHCTDAEVAERNAKILYAKEDIPTNTNFFRELQTFRALKETERKISGALRVPLHPPGKIIFLVKTKTLRAFGFKTLKTKYTPQWAEKTDFNEILVSATAIQDHSADVVQENLANILVSFREGAECDEDDSSVNKENITSAKEWRNEDYLILEREFICCSCPQGNVVFIPVFFASVALLLTLLSNNWCAYVSRTTEVTRQGDCELPRRYIGRGVSTGIWAYLEKVYSGSGPEDDPNSYVDSDLCLAYPRSFTPDGFMTAARVFAVMCGLFGSLTMVALWFASCIDYRQRTWYILAFILLLVSMFQGLVFLIYRSDLCGELVINSGGCLMDAVATCSMGWGAKVGMAALVLWFFAAVSAAKCGHNAGRGRFSSRNINVRHISRRFKKKPQDSLRFR